jgi:hypothetical protein
LIDYLWFYVPLKNFLLTYGDVTIAGEGLQNSIFSYPTGTITGDRAANLDVRLLALRVLLCATPATTPDLG